MAGLPDIDSLATYGGPLANFAPVVDPTTDEDAAWRNLYAMNVAMLGHTAPRALRSFVGHATAPTDPVSGFVHDALWGNSAPVKSTVAKDGGAGTGRYTSTWPTTIVDELGVTHTINLRRAHAWAEGSTAYHCQAEISSANVVMVRVTDMAGAAADAAGVTINIVAY